MDNFLKSCEEDYYLWRDKPKKFRKKLLITQLVYGLKGKGKLEHLESPVYFSGNYKSSSSFVIFGLNPGKQKTWKKEHEDKKRDSWQSNLDYMQNRFLYIKDNNENPPYYNHFWYLFEGLMRIKKIKIPSKWEFFHDKVLNINLFPYHSIGFNLSRIKNQSQFEYLKKDIEQRLEFIKKNMTNPRLFIFHGSIWFDMLDKLGFLKHDEVDNVRKNFNIYYFEIDSNPCVLFNIFFPSAFYQGVTDLDKARKIPKLILKRYPDLSLNFV